MLNVNEEVKKVVESTGCGVDLKIDIVPYCLFGPVFEVIPVAENMAEEKGLNIFQLAGRMSDEVDANVIEMDISTDENVNFWMGVLTHYMKGNGFEDSAIEDLEKQIRCARAIGRTFFRLEE